MPLDPRLFQGLSDFGLSQPSQSSSVDDSFGLEELLTGNSILDEAAKAKVLEQALSETQGREVPGVLDRLKSPQGLLALLGTIAAGAVGGAPAAAGFGLGSLQNAGVATEAERSQKRAAIDDLTERLEKTQDRLANAQQRVATIFNTNPEAFVDPVTGEQKLSPEVLGFYATGAPIELFATSRRAAQRRDDMWSKRYDLMTKRLEGAQTREERETILSGLFRLMDFPQDQELLEALASAPAEDFPVDMANMYLKYGGETGLTAIIQAGERGLPLWHPEIARLIQYRNPDVDGGGKRTPADRFLELVQEINAWSTDPANLDRMREIRTEHGKAGEGAVSTAIAREVLGGRRGDFDIYMDEAELRTPDVLASQQAMFEQMQKQYQLGIGMAGIDKTPFVRGMTDEERSAWLWRNAGEAVEAQRQAERDEQAKADLGIANGVVGRLRKDLKVGPAEANQFAQEIMRLALTRATRPDGSVDRARFEQEVRKITDEAVAGATTE